MVEAVDADGSFGGLNAGKRHHASGQRQLRRLWPSPAAVRRKATPAAATTPSWPMRTSAAAGITALLRHHQPDPARGQRGTDGGLSARAGRSLHLHHSGADRGELLIPSCCTSPRPISRAAGDREFNVAINGTTVLTNLDIYGTVGKDAASAGDLHHHCQQQRTNRHRLYRRRREPAPRHGYRGPDKLGSGQDQSHPFGPAERRLRPEL